MHYCSPKQLKSAISNIYNLLNPGGRVYIIAITPYVKRYVRFIPEYKRRVANNEEFPGFVMNLKDWVNEASVTPTQRNNIADEPFMFLDRVVLTRLFRQQNFNVLESKMISMRYYSSSWSLDGRELVILIAEKP